MQNNVISIHIIHFTQTGKYQIYCKKNAGHKKSAIFTDIIPHKRLYCTYIANRGKEKKTGQKITQKKPADDNFPLVIFLRP